jgi:hypothetical protein
VYGIYPYPMDSTQQPNGIYSYPKSGWKSALKAVPKFNGFAVLCEARTGERSMIFHIALVISLLNHAPKSGYLTGNCRAQSSFSDDAITFLTRIVTSGDAGNIKLRQSYNLPAVNSSPAVSLVSDDSTCAAAAAALQALYNDGVSHAPVWVLKVAPLVT